MDFYDKLRRSIRRNSSEELEDHDLRECFELIVSAIPYKVKKDIDLKLHSSKLSMMRLKGKK